MATKKTTKPAPVKPATKKAAKAAVKEGAACSLDGDCGCDEEDEEEGDDLFAEFGEDAEEVDLDARCKVKDGATQAWITWSEKTKVLLLTTTKPGKTVKVLATLQADDMQLDGGAAQDWWEGADSVWENHLILAGEVEPDDDYDADAEWAAIAEEGIDACFVEE